ncbi:MAG TPA: hypothetical protein VKB53_05635, partial [Gammaproteobacteria bacterium]|nr:hypothetical protein [Gammaproteobacteria bacterium]
KSELIRIYTALYGRSAHGQTIGWAAPKMVSSIDELVMDVRTSEFVPSQPLSEILILDLPTMAALPAPRRWGGGSPL